MADQTGIEWTDATWNPSVGCSRVSEGCRQCYAEAMASRVANAAQVRRRVGGTLTPIQQAYLEVVRWERGGKDPADEKALPRWNGRTRMLPERLDQPLRWTKPRRIFVDSMSDLFHESVSNRAIAAVFGVMAVCPQHTFQVLTKRPERVLNWFAWAADHYDGLNTVGQFFDASTLRRMTDTWVAGRLGEVWPLPNVWLGVSAEDQATADERIPLLLQCPAAVRFVSLEPLLGPVDVTPYVGGNTFRCRCGFHDTEGELAYFGGDHYSCVDCGERCEILPALDWMIVGGESGPGARRCDARWIRSLVRQCREAGTAVFVKQLGSYAVDYPDYPIGLNDPKGGDMSEWDENLQVREFPGVQP